MSISIKHSNKFVQLAVVVFGLIAIGWLSQRVYFRLDLTSEKRYTLTESSRQFMKDLPSDMFVRVYLEGDLNSGFRRLSNATREILEEFKAEGGSKFYFDLLNPGDFSAKEKKAIQEELAEFGYQPQNVFENAEDGRQISSSVYPYAVVSYNDRVVAVNLLDNLPSRSGSENLNSSV
ncbi:MAG: Gldg family protein, partial [Carboxylicivirga sp.]|nr:Gldg family protein [Carboxylicivirga sp.]